MAKTYHVLIEGQIIPVPEEVGQDDAKVKAALTPFFPDVANALITRSEKGEVVTITITKKAGSKGQNLLMNHLLDCQGGMNPVIELYDEINREKKVSIEQLLTLDGRIDAAIEAGKKEANRVDYALERLTAAQAQPAPVMVQGF